VDKAYNYQGSNGEEHRFTLADMTNPRALPQRGGVVVIVRGPQEPVYISDASSIRGLLSEAGIWHRAKHEFGAAGVYLLASGNTDWCRNVAENLRDRYRPTMNG